MFVLKIEMMENKKSYTQAEYAELKNVSRAYINKLMKNRKLITTMNDRNTKALIVNCDANDKVFKINH